MELEAAQLVSELLLFHLGGVYPVLGEGNTVAHTQPSPRPGGKVGGDV